MYICLNFLIQTLVVSVLFRAIHKGRQRFWAIFDHLPSVRISIGKAGHCHKGICFPLTPPPLLGTFFIGGPIAVICLGLEMDIISGIDLPKDIKWTYFLNWKHIRHKIRQNSGGGPEVLLFGEFTLQRGLKVFLNIQICIETQEMLKVGATE